MKNTKEVGEGGIWNCIRERNLDESTKKAERGIKTKIDQEIQLDWSKIDRSNCKFCAGYKYQKNNIEMKNIGKKKNWKRQLKKRGRD